MTNPTDFAALIESTITKSGLRPKLGSFPYHEFAVIQQLAIALNTCGIPCDIVNRPLTYKFADMSPNKKGKSASPTDGTCFSAAYAIVLPEGEVFNLHGSSGWDQILQDYLQTEKATSPSAHFPQWIGSASLDTTATLNTKLHEQLCQIINVLLQKQAIQSGLPPDESPVAPPLAPKRM